MGYGDFTPKTDIGKIFTMVYIFIGLGILISFVTPIGELIIDQRLENVEKKKTEREISENEYDFSGIGGKLSREKKK